MRWMTSLLCAALWTVAVPALAQKIPVEVTHSGRDNIGRQFAFELRDALRGSNSFRLVEGESKEPRIVISVVSLSVEDTDNRSSALSISKVVDAHTIPVNGIYITSGVRIVGANRVKTSAGALPAEIDEAVDFLRSKWPAVYKLLVPASQ